MKSIHDYLEKAYETWADRPYIHTKEQGVWHAKTFREVIDDVRALSRSLLQLGLGHRNIMICSENSYEWTILYLGIMGYVGTCVPVDREWTSYDFCHTLSVIDTAAVFYSRAKSACMDELQEQYPDISWFCIEDTLPGLIRTGRRPELWLTGQTDPAQTVMILFTSGTTDLPKAIPLTQENLFANWDTLYRRTPMTAADRSCIFLPLHHVYTGVANFLYSIISGMQIWLCPDLSRMVPELMEIRPTILCTVPLLLYRMYEAMTDELLAVLRDIRFLYCGGSFTDPGIKQYFIQNGVNLLEAYGTTETSSVIALAVPGDPETDSNGVVFENLEVWIEAPDENGVGEIVVRGKSVSAGYLDQNSRSCAFDPDGAYHTGDLGRLDDHRRLYLKGRKRRMILTAAGKNIYVDELEELLLGCPGIRAAKVYEEAHHPAAAVVTDLPEANIQTHVDRINRLLPRYKQIRRVHIKPDTLGGRIK